MKIKNYISVLNEVRKNGGIFKRLFMVHFSRHEFFWKFFNRRSNGRYKSCDTRISRFSKKVADEVSKQGYSVRMLSDFLDKDHINKLENDVLQRFKSEPRAKDETWVSQKEYIKYYEGGFYPEIQTFSLNSIFHKLAINENIINVANLYFESIGNLCHVELNICNVLSDNETTQGSQRAHRDPALKHTLKVFIYWSDVSKDGGPFSYFPFTHSRGNLRCIAKNRKVFGGSFYPPKSEYESISSKELIGKKGTIIFCDTAGLHYGGFSRDKPRKMSTFVYYPEIDFVQPRLRINASDVVKEALSKQQKYALGMKKN